MNRVRRHLLKVFSIWPLSLAAPGILAAQVYVVIDGWVMKRTDLKAGLAPRTKPKHAR
jgi:hypothetical protein